MTTYSTLNLSFFALLVVTLEYKATPHDTSRMEVRKDVSSYLIASQAKDNKHFKIIA